MATTGLFSIQSSSTLLSHFQQRDKLAVLQFHLWRTVFCAVLSCSVVSNSLWFLSLPFHNYIQFLKSLSLYLWLQPHVVIMYRPLLLNLETLLMLFFFLNFIYFFYFLAALGLCCCKQALSSCVVKDSCCSGFSHRRVWALGAWASAAAAQGVMHSNEHRLTNCGTWA